MPSVANRPRTDIPNWLNNFYEINNIKNRFNDTNLVILMTEEEAKTQYPDRVSYQHKMFNLKRDLSIESIQSLKDMEIQTIIFFHENEKYTKIDGKLIMAITEFKIDLCQYTGVFVISIFFSLVSNELLDWQMRVHDPNND